MFEDLEREMKKLERHGGEHRMEIHPDEKGYVDKECPREECGFVFKVNDEDWGELFRDEAVYCPRCREEAPSDHWWTTEQLEEAERRTRQHANHMVNNALRRGARAFNRRQPRNSLVSMTMSVKGAHSRRPINLPMSAREVMEQELQCGKCKARYSVVGIGYFCPCCGHNSVLQTFDASMRKVQTKLSGLGEIRKALVATHSADDIESMCQSVVESCFGDCVMAFQHVLEQLYVRIPSTGTPPFNAFQRLQQGSELWEAALGTPYENWLSPGEHVSLQRLFQQRHLLAHRDGMVDQKYIDNSGDSSYRVGQRLVVRGEDARELARLVQLTVDGIKAEMAGQGLV